MAYTPVSHRATVTRLPPSWRARAACVSVSRSRIRRTNGAWSVPTGFTVPAASAWALKSLLPGHLAAPAPLVVHGRLAAARGPLEVLALLLGGLDLRERRRRD
jgi:hypothetical protein